MVYFLKILDANLTYTPLLLHHKRHHLDNPQWLICQPVNRGYIN